MKLVVFVLNRTEHLEEILGRLESMGVRGATILHSRGMAMALENYFDGDFVGSLRAELEPERKENRTVFAVMPDALVPQALDAVEEIAGSFDSPNSGIAFSLPVGDVRGIPES